MPVNFIDRTDAAGLLQDQEIDSILQEATASSVALNNFRTMRMGTKIANMPILTGLPTASWVNGDSGLKATSDQIWEKKTMTAEELAVIVPIPEAVFEDSEFGVWEEVRPRIAEAFGAALDGAVFFGTNKPASWPDALEDGARTATNVLDRSATTPDLAEAVNQAWALVEGDGYDVNFQVASRALRPDLRGLRDSQNRPLYLDGLRSDNGTSELMGVPLTYMTNGAWVPLTGTFGVNDAGADMIVGDVTKAILGVRTDVRYKVLTEATLDDGAGNLIHLAQQDMIALRAHFRVGFQVADTYSIETGARGYPFAVISD